MKKAILATKVGMTQVFNEDGVLTPVTVLQAGPSRQKKKTATMPYRLVSWTREKLL